MFTSSRPDEKGSLAGEASAEELAKQLLAALAEDGGLADLSQGSGPAANGKAKANGGAKAKGRAGQGQQRGRTARPGRNGNRNGSGGGNGRGHAAIEAEISKAKARRVATKVGRGMLVASNLETARHSDDVVVITRAMCDLLEIKGSERQDLLAAAHLHDIGKAAVPREVIEKPGPLTAAEWKVMRAHTEVGERILASVPELEGIARLVRSSHERWDGGGYPDGLAGEEIPRGSRIIFCADAFHAIRSDRPYRPGRPAAHALAEIREHSGSQFDPDVVIALEQVARELRIAPAVPRVRRSSRLMALFLCLAVGGTGSAIARSGLLGDPTAGVATPPAVAEVCNSPECSPLLSITLADMLGFGDARGASGKGRASLRGPGALEPGKARKDPRKPKVDGGRDGVVGPELAPPSVAPPGGGSVQPDEGGAKPPSKGKGKGRGRGRGNHPHGGPPGKSGGRGQGNGGGNGGSSGKKG